MLPGDASSLRRNHEARTEYSGSARAERSPSFSSTGRDSNADRRQRSNGHKAAGKSKGKPQGVENGETDTALAPPCKTRNDKVATRGGAPPALPARPLGDASTGGPSGRSASRSSDARGASNRSNKPRGADREISAEKGSRVAGKLPSSGTGEGSGKAARRCRANQSSRAAGGATGHTTGDASKDVSATTRCISIYTDREQIVTALCLLIRQSAISRFSCRKWGLQFAAGMPRPIVFIVDKAFRH